MFAVGASTQGMNKSDRMYRRMSCQQSTDGSCFTKVLEDVEAVLGCGGC
jgi:hypothetical protein